MIIIIISAISPINMRGSREHHFISYHFHSPFLIPFCKPSLILYSLPLPTFLPLTLSHSLPCLSLSVTLFPVSLSLSLSSLSLSLSPLSPLYLSLSLVSLSLPCFSVFYFLSPLKDFQFHASLQGGGGRGGGRNV